MAGTKAGGEKAKKTNIERYGDDFYKRIGSIGGRNGHTGGFYNNPKLASEAGAKGGRISSRAGIKNGEGKKALADIEEAERILEEEYGRDSDAS